MKHTKCNLFRTERQRICEAYEEVLSKNKAQQIFDSIFYALESNGFSPEETSDDMSIKIMVDGAPVTVDIKI